MCMCMCAMFALVSLESLIFPFIENALWCHVNFAIKVNAMWAKEGNADGAVMWGDCHV